MYIQIFNLLQKLFYKGGAGVYDTTNQVLFREYRKCHCPDGQIVFPVSYTHLDVYKRQGLRYAKCIA